MTIPKISPYDVDIDKEEKIFLPDDQNHTHIIFWSIEQDDIGFNPLEDCDGNGKIISLSSRHINYDTELFEKSYKDPNCVILGYFEHGHCDWHVSGDRPAGTEGDYRWDGVDVAGLWIPDKYALEELKAIRSKAKRRERAVELATQAAKGYTDYCNGDCYYFRFALYEIKEHEDGYVYDDSDDYRFDTAIEEDSCGGFLGYDNIKHILNEHINPLIEDAFEKFHT
jgi:hypothetical protein